MGTGCDTLSRNVKQRQETLAPSRRCLQSKSVAIGNKLEGTLHKKTVHSLEPDLRLSDQTKPYLRCTTGRASILLP